MSAVSEKNTRPSEKTASPVRVGNVAVRFLGIASTSLKRQALFQHLSIQRAVCFTAGHIAVSPSAVCSPPAPQTAVATC